MLNKQIVSKQLIKEWNTHIQWLNKECIVKEDIGLKEERKNKALTDYNYFCQIYFPHYVYFNDILIPNAPFHTEAVNKIAESENIYAGLCWARSHSKTTHISLIMIIWLILQRKTNHVLLVSNNTTDVTKILQHIEAEFSYNSQLISDFAEGTFQTTGSWSRSSIVINSYDCAINTCSKSTSPRGIRYRNYRPDLIIIDDLDDKESCMNNHRINEQWLWVKESLIPVINIKKYRIVYVQNLFSNNSIFYRYLTEIPNIYKSRVDALLPDGTVTWKERFTIEDFEKLKTVMGTLSFNREYMNSPILEGSIFHNEWIKFGDISLTKDNFIVMYFDPSFTDKGDYKSICVMTKHNEKFYIIDVFLRKCSINTSISWIYDTYEKYHSLGCNIYLYLESSFSQDMVWNELQQVTTERGYNLPVLFDSRVKSNKYGRIEASSSWYERGMVVFNKDIETLPDTKRLIEQYLGFEQGSNMNDDGPDSVESAIYFVNRNTRNFKSQPLIEINEENIRY